MNESSPPPQRRLAIYALLLVTASALCWTIGGIEALHSPLVSAGIKVEKAEKSTKDSQAEKSQNPSVSEPSAIGKSAEAEIPTVKLNYVSKSWDKVLEDVATATSSELIMDRIPSGRYSRRDSNKYNRRDAVRILNKDIEPLGFRLLEKGDFLIVIDLPGHRARTQPAVVAESGVRSQESGARSQQAESKRADAVRPVSYEEPKETVPAPNEGRLADATLVIYRPRNRSAMDLSRQLYRDFKPQAQLISSGRNRLPAFRITKDSPDAKPSDLDAAVTNASFTVTVSIDEKNDELLIDAMSRDAEAVLKLLRSLDR